MPLHPDAHRYRTTPSSATSRHKREPGKQVAPEQPLRFKQLVLRAMAEGIISRERAEGLNPGVVSLDSKEKEVAIYEYDENTFWPQFAESVTTEPLPTNQQR